MGAWRVPSYTVSPPKSTRRTRLYSATAKHHIRRVMLIPQFQITDDAVIIGRLKRYSSDVDWIDEHRDELREKYPDKYVAVKNHRVLFTASTMAEVVKLIDETSASAEDCAVEYISADELNVL